MTPYIPQSLFSRYKAVEEAAYHIRKEDTSSTTRVWIRDDFELRVRERGSKTPWANIIPEALTNLPAQAPRKPRKSIDTTDKNTPPTPGYIESNSPKQSVHSRNIFNFLREEEA